MSPKRNNILKNINQEQLIKLCETRWTERHESVLKFKLCLSNIVECLEIISQWEDRETSSKAQNLLNSILVTNFIVGIFSLCLTFCL